MGMDISQIIWIAFLSIVSICLIKISFSVSFKFDLNVFLKERKERLKRKAQTFCPHQTLLNNKIISTFINPPGTSGYICNQCGLIVMSEEIVEAVSSQSSKEFLRRSKKFYRIWKKI